MTWQVVVQVPEPPTLPPIPDFPHTPAPWEVMPPAVILLITLAVLAAGTIVLWPLMRALGRRIEGKIAADPALRQEVEDLRARLAEVDQLQHRVMELEERVDFTERLLAQQREPERLRQGEV